jgi:DNA repair photolyase
MCLLKYRRLSSSCPFPSAAFYVIVELGTYVPNSTNNDEVENVSRHIRYEPLQSKTVLNKVTAPSMPFRWSINPYRGCQHGCSFCYARSTHSFMGIAADDTFQNHIFFKSNAVEALEEQLGKMARTKGGTKGLGHVAIGTATDPYQPVEAKAKLTRGCLEVLAKYEVPVTITTRSPLILRDVELLQQMNVLSVNVSISTLDRSVWRNFEPSTPFPAKRLETVQALQEAGVRTGVFMAPILPYVADRSSDLEALIEQAAKHRAAFAMCSFLRLSTQEVKVWFFQALREHYPHLVSNYAALYSNSSYAPKSYREPIQARLRDLLNRYGLVDVQPLRRDQHESLKQEEMDNDAPVQLSFSF